MRHDPPNVGAELQHQWLADRLEEIGKTQLGLAQELGVAPARVTDIVKGQRRIQINELAVIASYLRLSVRDVLEQLEVPIGKTVEGSVSVSIRGTVQAGNWRPAGEWQAPEDEWETVVVPKPNGYSGLFGLHVAGTSMNLIYPEGTILFFCPIHEFRDLRTEEPWDHVLVLRKRHGEAEATVKEYRVDKTGRQWLWPRSDDPQHQQPLELPQNGQEWPQDDEIEIIAAVVSEYRRHI